MWIFLLFALAAANVEDCSKESKERGIIKERPRIYLPRKIIVPEPKYVLRPARVKVCYEDRREPYEKEYREEKPKKEYKNKPEKKYKEESKEEKREHKEKKCQRNEVYLTCRSCEGTCKVPLPKCTRECRPPGCQCKAGYVRHRGKCILLKDCPKYEKPKKEYKYKPEKKYKEESKEEKREYKGKYEREYREEKPVYKEELKKEESKEFEPEYKEEFKGGYKPEKKECKKKEHRQYIEEAEESEEHTCLKIIERHQPKYTVKTKVAAPVYILPKHGPVVSEKYEPRGKEKKCGCKEKH